jgi:hypothetical protein
MVLAPSRECANVILNLSANQEQYTQPRSSGYRNKLIIAFDERIIAHTIPQLQIPVERIFVSLT